MRLPLDGQHSFDFRLRSALLLLLGALLVLGLAPSLAAAAEEAEGPLPPTEPVIVPEVEAPQTPTVTTPETTTSQPAPAPSSSPAQSPSAAPVTHTTTRSTHSSGGSAPSPTTVNHSVHSPSGGSGSNGASHHSGGSGSTSPVIETGTSSSPTSTAASPTRDVEGALSHLATRAGHGGANDKQGRQKALGDLGSAVGKALIGSQVKVAAPAHKDQIPAFVPLPGKSKTIYFLAILAILAVAALVVWLQFRGPRDSRRWKARIDHRTSARLSPAERARARADGRRWAAAEHTPQRPRPRRKAA
jgi:hypothetical protein